MLRPHPPKFDAKATRWPAPTARPWLPRRITELPKLVFVTLRSGEQTADHWAVSALGGARSRPGPAPGSLCADGVAATVATVFPHAEREFCNACTTVTNGSPFALTELLCTSPSPAVSPARNGPPRVRAIRSPAHATEQRQIVSTRHKLSQHPHKLASDR